MSDPFSVFTSDNNDTEEPKKEDEDTSEAEIVIEEVVSSVPELEYISLEELADSDFIRNRQVAAKSIVEYLHHAGSNKEALHSVISVMCKLSEDEDIMVRSELIEQIPSIALFCKEHSEDLGVVIRQQIVPYTVKLLTDIQRQNRKTGHSTLLVLLENNVIDDSQLTEWICPLIAQLVTSENIPEGCRLEDISVMCKMIPYVGKEITEKFFLEPFLQICRDSSFFHREECLVNFSTISQVVGRETTEKTLLCAFLDLCQESWDVRSKCVDIAIDLASVVSPTTRNEILAPIYLSFLKEQSLSVSETAYMSLGRFISTFAEPSKTGLKYDSGMWIEMPAENDNTDDTLPNLQYHQDQGHCFDFFVTGIISKPKFLEECSFKNLNNAFENSSDDLQCTLSSSSFSKSKLQIEPSSVYESSRYSSTEFFSSTVFNNLSDVPNFQNKETISSAISSLNISSKEKNVCLYSNNENIFNNFQFWKMPLPEVDLDVEDCKYANFKSDVESKQISSSSELESTVVQKQDLNSEESDILEKTDDSKLNKDDRSSPELHVKSFYVQFKKKSPFNFVRDQDLESSKEKSDQMSLNKKQMTDTEKMVYDQDIVPPELLMHYINDVTVNDNVMNITYYFPSVVYTLGKKHWPCIRDLFNTMSSVLKFSIRKIVASFLHELAIILGPEITTEDLLPVFLRFLKDSDIRHNSSLMKNMSKFLKKTKPQARRQFLPLIEKICSWDEDDHNWRNRLTVSEQLIFCVELFTSYEALHFLPASLLIMQDKISAVRRSGVELLAVIIKSIATNPKSSNFLKVLLCALDEKYRISNKWLWRQFYVFICQDLAAKKSLHIEFYVKEVFPNLLSLTWDAVPNVRLAVARCLALTLFPLDFLPTIQKMHSKLMFQAISSLKNDVDRDVRYFAHLSAASSEIFIFNLLEEDINESQYNGNEV